MVTSWRVVKADRKRRRELGRVVGYDICRFLMVGMRLRSECWGGCESKKANEIESRVKECIESNDVKQ